MTENNLCRNRREPFGTAWIFGHQKPFYNPRRIFRGQFQGMIEVEYLAKAGIYRKTKIHPEDITDTNPNARRLAHQMQFAEILPK